MYRLRAIIDKKSKPDPPLRPSGGRFGLLPRARLGACLFYITRGNAVQAIFYGNEERNCGIPNARWIACSLVRDDTHFPGKTWVCLVPGKAEPAYHLHSNSMCHAYAETPPEGKYPPPRDYSCGTPILKRRYAKMPAGEGVRRREQLPRSLHLSHTMVVIE